MVGQVTTDGFGNAHVTFRKVSMAGYTSWFATLHGSNGWNDSTIFSTN